MSASDTKPVQSPQKSAVPATSASYSSDSGKLQTKPSPPSAIQQQEQQSEDSERSANVPESRFSPEEEISLLQESHSLKSQANSLFSTSRYTEAISTYDQALASCPNYLEYELAVLHSNIAACHLKLQCYKDAVESATKALDGLERELPTKAPSGEKLGDGKDKSEVIELEDGADDEAELSKLKIDDKRRSKVESLRAKSLLRRAKANQGLNSWSALAAAEGDYKILSASSILPPGDKKFVRQQLAILPAQVKQAQEKEVGEMMGKLKDLGNGLLKPFGLSTDMFNFVKDEGSGGYSMSFGKKD